MIKKLLFITTLYIFSSNAFSALYDDQELNDGGSSSQSPVLFDTSSFGFEKLKEFIKLKNNKKAKAKIKTIEDQNAARIKQALGLRLQKKNEEAENLFKEGAAEGCPSAMYWLGLIDEESGQDNQAFSWYMLSFLNYIARSDIIGAGFKKSEAALNKINKLLEKNDFCQTRKKFYLNLTDQLQSSINKYSFSNGFVRHTFALIFNNHFCKNFPRDQKLTTFVMSLIQWNAQSIKTDQTESVPQECLSLIGSKFFDLEGYPEAAYCFRLTKSNRALSYLGYLIAEKKCNYDENNKLILKKNRNKIASTLLSKANDSFISIYLADGIMHGKFLFNCNGQKIALNEKDQIAADLLWKYEDNIAAKLVLANIVLNRENLKNAEGEIMSSAIRYEYAANLLRQIQTPSAKARLGNLIRFSDTNKDLFGNEFEEHRRAEIAAELFRESKTPDACCNLGEMIYADLTLKNLEGKDIDSDQKNEEVAQLMRMSRTDDAYENLGELIVTKLTHSDLDGNSFLEEDRYEIAADLFRKSKGSQSLKHLANLIIQHLIKTDLSGNLITSPEQEIKALIELFELSDKPCAKFNLAIIMLNSQKNISIETKRKAHKLMKIAALQGIKEADICCALLQNEIQLEEKDTRPDNTLLDESNSKDLSDKDAAEISQDAEKGQSSLESLSLEQRLKIKALKKEQKKKEYKKTAQKFKNLLHGKIKQNDLDSFLIHQEKTMKKTSKVIWDKKAEKDWQKHDPALKTKITELIRDIKEGGNRGKPEILKLTDLLSRHINKEHRLIYKTLNNGDIEIFQCVGHYDD
ncbi:MAG: type II toxin-antitoxin system YoeB family toxin [Alphaproteobacteria bacterium]|nr:type II toxin-antitoxin system YoeB family toxin [Alphaproteobacteria bacterium]